METNSSYKWKTFIYLQRGINPEEGNQNISLNIFEKKISKNILIHFYWSFYKNKY